MHTPGLVQRSEHISGNDLIAHEAQIPEQLVVMRLAVGQAALLVMTMTQEGFLALRANKMLHVPVLAQRRDYSLLYRTTAGATNGNAHLVVAAQAI